MPTLSHPHPNPSQMGRRVKPLTRGEGDVLPHIVSNQEIEAVVDRAQEVRT